MIDKKKIHVLLQVAGFSAALHALVLLIVGSITVYQFMVPPDPEFEAPPPMERVEPQKLEYKLRSKNLQKNSTLPRPQAISVKALSQIDTPEINVALPRFETRVAVGLGTGAGLGMTQGLTSGGLGLGRSAINFFGVESRGERIVFVFDISTTVVNRMQRAGMPITRVRDKMIELIRELNPGTVFAMIQHSRNYDRFLPEMISAIPENRERAVQWLRSEFRTDGSGRGWTREEPNGIQSVLRVAFAMNPDLIFLLSDASYYRTVGTRGGERVPWNELAMDIHAWQQELDRPATIHFIGFGVSPEDARGISAIIRRNKGEYREFQAAISRE